MPRNSDKCSFPLQHVSDRSDEIGERSAPEYSAPWTDLVVLSPDVKGMDTEQAGPLLVRLPFRCLRLTRHDPRCEDAMLREDSEQTQKSHQGQMDKHPLVASVAVPGGDGVQSI